MEQRDVTARVPAKEEGQEDLEATIYVSYPESLDEAKDWCGEEALLTNAFANWRVTLQGNIRNKLRAGMTPEQINEMLKDAIMGVAQAGVKTDPQQMFLMKFKSATKEEQEEMIAKLREAAQG